VFYAESQQLLEQERLEMTISQKTFYSLLRRQPGGSSNPSTIDGLLALLYESDFVYRTPFYTSRPKEDEYSSREDSWQANSRRATSTATCARTVLTSYPTSIYSTRQAIKGAESKAGGLLAESQPQDTKLTVWLGQSPISVQGGGEVKYIYVVVLQCDGISALWRRPRLA
jgi:hypothetical protein